jgi:peroxiredoxin
MKTKDLTIAVTTLILLGALAYVWLAPGGLKQAPNIAVTTIDGRQIQLADLRGRPVLITFWATSCPGCVQEMPHLIELYHELAPKGLEIIGIAMSYDPPNHVLEMAKERQIPYPIALDATAAASQAFGEVKLTPTSFLIAPDGRIVQQKIGEMDMPTVRQTILNMLSTRTASAG